MSDRSSLRFVILAIAAAIAEPVAAQSPGPEAPSVAQIVKLLRSGAGYASLIRQSLRWRPAPSSECLNLKNRIDSPFIPVPDSVGGPDLALNSKARLEAYHRAEENMLSQLALFSQQVYDAVRLDCFELPEQAPLKPPPGVP